MKAKGIPEKIYLQVCGDCNMEYCDNCKFDDLEDNVTWSKDRIFAKDVEYIRSDAFIEKADKFISTFFHPDDKELIDVVLKEFHKHMKGE